MRSVQYDSAVYDVEHPVRPRQGHGVQLQRVSAEQAKMSQKENGK